MDREEGILIILQQRKAANLSGTYLLQRQSHNQPHFATSDTRIPPL
jgi:hypothetical protein